MKYDRTIIAYHGCDEVVAEGLLRGEKFKPSVNDYDWLGSGIYFWEYGADRAMQFATTQVRRKKVKKPAVIGALIQLGLCFDLMDTRFTSNLASGFKLFADAMKEKKVPLPKNDGATSDKLLRRLDCAVINWYLTAIEGEGMKYDTVRCGFVEGSPVYEGAGIHHQTHLQIAVRNPGCILGVFRPMIDGP